MNKRMIIKTALICTGIYIILTAIAIFVLNLNYQLDTEKRINVMVALNDVLPGEVIKDSMVEYRSIRESDFSTNMLIQPDQCINFKTSAPVKSGDYIFSYNLISPDKWKTDDARTIVIPMSIDERLANLIKKGSVINIKVMQEGIKTIPKVVLSRITVSDMLDENGLPMADLIGNKKAYAVVTLDDRQRDRLYAAMQDGMLMYELYCDLTQPKEEEDYIIPPEFFDESYLQRNMEQDTNSKIKTDGGEN